MSQPIIEVKNLSKQYRIGVDTTYKTLSESVNTTLRHLRKDLEMKNIFLEKIIICKKYGKE
ncbi:MAG: hypothetical protein SCH39_04405 [Methanosarcinales archaeon]|nr:hypothetical protein [Methanosarcinales archaeon]